MGAEALLASNTSSLSIDAMASGSRRPNRFLGMHFFNPVPASALIEIIVGTRTGDAVLDAAHAVAVALGKTSIVVRDAPGFATSRLGLRTWPLRDAWLSVSPGPYSRVAPSGQMIVTGRPRAWASVMTSAVPP